VVWGELALPSGEANSPELSGRAMNDSNFDRRALYRNGILVLLLVSIALIVHNIFGQNGFLALRRQQRELQTIQRNMLRLQQENEQLDIQNRALKSNPAAIERKAREDMHLVKPGEKVYTLPDKTGPDPRPSSDKGTSPLP